MLQQVQIAFVVKALVQLYEVCGDASFLGAIGSIHLNVLGDKDFT